MGHVVIHPRLNPVCNIPEMHYDDDEDDEEDDGNDDDDDDGGVVTMIVKHPPKSKVLETKQKHDDEVNC